jgi:uncharacterized protein (DUF2249 family)/iron-sulfur cluster repair protein YtfE (RIC family)
MTTLALASNPADAAAAAAVEQHHAQLSGALALKVEAVVTAVDWRVAQHELVAWCRRELVPHALAEEQALYPAAHGKPEARLLIDGMLAEHAVLTGLVSEVAAADSDIRAAAAATALRVLFDSHLQKENELVLPLLVADPEVSVAALLEGMHELLGAAHGAAEEDGCGHQCTCGEADGPDLPELDARAVPHAIRHATIFGALDSIRPGGGLVLIAPHDPLPLLKQVEQRAPGAFEVSYRERGPEAWLLAFVRRA